MLKKLTITVFILVSVLRSTAQVDPHFSQYYAFPLWMNPAMTGMMEGTYRATAIYRNQWNSVMIPFSTIGFSADINTSANLNLGIDVLNQTAGDAGYKYQVGGIDIAYSGVKFGKDKSQQLGFGFHFGLIGRSFDPSKFQAGDQWNPGTGFDPSTASADVYSKTSASAFDVNAGVFYIDGSTDKSVNFFAGFSGSHLTEPEDPFIAGGSKAFLPVRLTAHGGAKIYLGNNFSMTPHFLYMKQGNATEKMAGLFGEATVSENLSLFAGVNYRFNDAIAPMIGFSYNKLNIGASYDVNNSDLGKAVPGTNSFEISLTWTGGEKRSKSTFNFGCPRL